MPLSRTALQKKRKWIDWLVWVMWAFAILGFCVFSFIFFRISNGDLPSFADLENPKYDFASMIYDATGKTYGKYYIENREHVSFDSLSPTIVNALLSTEDARYMNHSGVDLRALFRVGFKTLLLRKSDSGGGSTISQQLAKLLFDRPNLRGKSQLEKAIKLAETKFKEWIVAIKLEKSYTKEEIIAMYLNKFEFINGAHGIQAAAGTYFGKKQDKLSVDEAALLIGMLKNPSLYNPLRFPEKAQNRRNIVLTQLMKYRHIDKRNFDTLRKLSVDMSDFNRKTQSEGVAPYFRSELTKWLKNLFQKDEFKKADGSVYNIYKDGLKIYTTIDLAYQEIAEKAVFQHMSERQKAYWNVWKGRNPWTYDANQNQREIRNDILQRRVKASDRYLSLRKKHLSKSIDKIRSKYKNLPLSDNVIKTLIDIENKTLSFNTAIEKKRLSPNRKKDYQDLMELKGWKLLKEQWDNLQEAFNKEFKETEYEMMVFDYNDSCEVKKTMTPYDSVKYHNQHLQAGMLAVDPHTGHIKAWVGGVNHKYFKYDHVNSRRQVGSTIKPFVYTTAISLQGISPCQEFDDIQYSIAPGDANFDLDKQWSPANANETFTGNKYNLYQGLLYSKNSITVKLVKEMGSVNVIRELLDNVGIGKDKRLDGGRLAVPNLPSMCLGAVDLTLLEMTGAYTAFANEGIYTEPIFISRIEDKNGKVIYQGSPKKNIAINPIYNAVMVDMLKNNVGGNFGMGIKTPAGGKTGTTNDYADGWFMGITPNLVVGTWVGGDDKWIRFLTLNEGQGFVMARPIFQKFLQGLEKDEELNFDTDVSFPKPPPEAQELIDCEKNKQIKPEDEQNQILEEQLRTDEFEEVWDEELEEELEEESEESEEEGGG